MVQLVYANVIRDIPVKLVHAWKLDQQGKSVAIVDAALGDEFESTEVLCSIRVVLLCVHKFPENRPNTSSIVFMLGNEFDVLRLRNLVSTQKEMFLLVIIVQLAHNQQIHRTKLPLHVLTGEFFKMA
ncbi:hypothetical protein ACS0TY_023081 [Phlomoides rotata]